MRGLVDPVAFIHDLSWDALPSRIQAQARRCLLDTLGVAFSGSQTELSRIIYAHVREAYAGQGSRLWLNGTEVSKPGAALAHGMTVDALDMHDGHPVTKGHAGAAVVPALFAALSPRGETGVSGRELLTALAVGYEIALRAGIALHATSPDYHSSGAWNALGCAAACSRLWGLNCDQTRHALGIAEYHGPRSQMMRCIDHPTMLKDGSGWGAMTGVSAAMLAGSGFTGAPALTVDGDAVREIWSTLGDAWEMDNLYFKPHAICRWAQPAVEGLLQVQAKHCISPQNMFRIDVRTFHHGVCLSGRTPENTEQAQYSLEYPLAAAAYAGRLGPSELCAEVLGEERVCALAGRIHVVEDPEMSACFPQERRARVQVTTSDGHLFDSGLVQARWDAEDPPSDQELGEKFRSVVHGVVPGRRAAELEQLVGQCAQLEEVNTLLRVLIPGSSFRWPSPARR
jgi:2-methylcitrate dehydratase PrpD